MVVQNGKVHTYQKLCTFSAVKAHSKARLLSNRLNYRNYISLFKEEERCSVKNSFTNLCSWIPTHIDFIDSKRTKKANHYIICMLCSFDLSWQQYVINLYYWLLFIYIFFIDNYPLLEYMHCLFQVIEVVSTRLLKK